MRDAAIRAALGARERLAALDADPTPSQARRLFASEPPESAVLAAALATRQGASGSAELLREWAARLRHVRLAIDGTDLLAAGVPQGPEVGARLQAALDARLDGRVGDGREDQLRAALEARL
jgi:tRNA nucleotidyltransferase (CCA-adding enzyme)